MTLLEVDAVAGLAFRGANRWRVAAVIVLLQAFVVAMNGFAVMRSGSDLRRRFPGTHMVGSSVPRGAVQVVFAALLCVASFGLIRKVRWSKRLVLFLEAVMIAVGVLHGRVLVVDVVFVVLGLVVGVLVTTSRWPVPASQASRR